MLKSKQMNWEFYQQNGYYSLVIRFLARFIVFSILLAALLVGTFVLFPKDSLNYVLRNTLGHNLKCSEAHLSLLNSTLECTHLKGWAGTKQESLWEFEAGKILVHYSFSQLLQGTQLIEEIKIDKPDVTLTEWDPVTKKKEEDKSQSVSRSKLTIKHFEVANGSFTYIAKDKGKKGNKGRIQFKSIASQISNIKRIRQVWQPIHAKASGMLDDGNINLDLNLDLSKTKPQFQVIAVIKNANLKDANSFTKPYSKVDLQGLVVNAKAKSVFDGAKLKTETEVAYKNLDVELESKKGDLPIATWLKETYFNLALCDERSWREAKEQNTDVVISDKSGSWVNFYLTGLLKSALKAACFEEKVEI